MIQPANIMNATAGLGDSGVPYGTLIYMVIQVCLRERECVIES